MAMERKTLTINLGSSSKKYALFENETRLFMAHFEKTAAGFEVAYDDETPTTIDENTYKNTLSEVIGRVKKKYNADITEVGIRIVGLGEEFSRHEIIDDEYKEKLLKESKRAPAHAPAVVAKLAELERLLPGVLTVAASDSAFHADMPPVAKRCAIPWHLSGPNGIERTGFHGLSVSSAVSQLEKLLGKIPERAIVCHMGSGTSITALLNGKSIETSMGYSPLGGVPASTRSGDLDPEIVLRLAEKSDVETIRRELYSESGLLALSGKSGDMRVLLDSAKNGDESSDFAIQSFAYHIKLFIGAYIGILGGLDALVFSGTIGVRSAPVRKRVLEGLSHLGIVYDAAANEKAKPNDNIADQKSSVKIFVLKTDEEKEIAKAARKVLGIG